MKLPDKRVSTRDSRRSTTAVIWGCATGMLAICLSLTNQPHQGNRGTIISLAILAGAAVSTVAIWRSSHQESQADLEDARQIRQLKERIINLETIASLGEGSWQPPIQTNLGSSKSEQISQTGDELRG